MYAGEHTAGTEFVIGPLFVAHGASAGDLAFGLLVGNLTQTDAQGRVRTTEVPGVRIGLVTGWRDADHVVTGTGEGQRLVLASVDVATGDSARLTALPNGQAWGSGVTVSAGALTAPTVHAVEPDWPRDPRLTALMVAGVVALALALGALGWRWRRGRA